MNQEIGRLQQSSTDKDNNLTVMDVEGANSRAQNEMRGLFIIVS